MSNEKGDGGIADAVAETLKIDDHPVAETLKIDDHPVAETPKIDDHLNNPSVSDGKGKKQKPTKSATVAKPKANTEPEVSISRIDIRVGLIMNVQKHPDADSLYMLEIDLGEGSLRTVITGLVNYVPPEHMQNRKVCVLCNLKPATMRGVKSQGMILTAANNDETQVELVYPPEAAPIGERISFPGFEGEPDTILNPKKKVWETVKVDLNTDNEMVAKYKDVPFTTSAGVCKAPSLVGGFIS